MPILNKIKPELNDKTKVFTLESFIIPSTTQPKFGENIINDYGLNLLEEDLTKEDTIRLLKLKDKFVGNNVTDDYLFEAFNFKKDNSDVADYFNSYIGSPGYLRIINNLNRWWELRHPYRKFYDNPDKGTLEWFKVAKRVEPHRYIVNMPTDLSFVSEISDEDLRVMVTGKYNDWGDGYEFSPIFVLGHEYAHGTAPHTVFGSAQFDSKSAQGEALAQNTNTKPGHDSKKKEKHADIWGLKYLLFKEGIYDSRWGRDITIEEIQKLRKKYPNLRPFLQMTDKQIMFQLNHIAMNTNHNKKLLAKKGGRLISKHQNGNNIFQDANGPIFNPHTKKWYNKKGEEISQNYKYKKDFGYTMYTKDGFAVNYNNKGVELTRRLGTQTNTIKSRQHYFDTDQRFTDSIKAISKRYGLNPNLVASRIARESSIDSGINMYNLMSFGLDTGLISSGLFYNVYGSEWGLDDFHSNMQKGKLNIREPWFKYTPTTFINEKGREVQSMKAPHWSYGIIATAAELEWRRNEMKKAFPNASEERLDQLASASFNLGVSGAIKLAKLGKIVNYYKPFIKLK